MQCRAGRFDPDRLVDMVVPLPKLEKSSKGCTPPTGDQPVQARAERKVTDVVSDVSSRCRK